MAETKREIERKYEVAGAADEGFELPDLGKVPGVAEVIDKGVVELDAVYYDTADQRLAADHITLRRRTGGDDAGWHLKIPVALGEGVRDEIRAPLSAQLPRSLAGLVRSRVRQEPLLPVVRLLSSRDVSHLTDAHGALLAEVSVDAVRAERADGQGGTAWTEIEVELADDGDPDFLGKVEKRLRKVGADRSVSLSKLARALDETGAKAPASRPAAPTEPGTAGDHVVAHLRTQRDKLVDLDPAVRRDLPDAVHQMRVAARRMRSAFKTYKKILDPAATEPVAEELKWLGGELGIDRDHEVLTERLTARIDDVPRTLLLGPVRGRLRIWAVARRQGSRRHTVAVLDSKRYLALLDALDALLADPPLLPAARKPAADRLVAAALKDKARLAARIEHALSLPAGTDRDVAMHEARKSAKRARYAGEAAVPALGKQAKRFAKRMKAVQSLLGDHQDSVVARETLRQLAIQAHAAGETAFTWGLLYGQEQAAAADYERELPGVWAGAAEAGLSAG
ncbi:MULTISPECIES: CYTH and CHAD domain-containing protein [unclassified Streptomyces]|uniref:CYTH and CHAD domain-containing protein n=1 Tax=unclassified Streptomyces TaxID=2593676 RepID=UPI000DBAB48A|nr:MULTISPECIES: CYTH and CHAD domain-containing protein [unclassified Streptomyces]MYT69691.1 CHAD domain-containing protein [Streptomyces sp. SID8367]RAJ70891.1 CHAD domain-containing protein [Streptomyces sp. PsTaAH-137]